MVVPDITPTCRVPVDGKSLVKLHNVLMVAGLFVHNPYVYNIYTHTRPVPVVMRRDLAINCTLSFWAFSPIQISRPNWDANA